MGFLKRTKISDKEISRIQYEEYKKGAISIALKLVEALEKEDFSIIKDFTGHSPAGDGYGYDNTLLSFSDIDDDLEDVVVVDVERAFEKIASYKNKINNNIKNKLCR